MISPAKVTLVEVGPRDGLQIEKEFIPTETKIAIVNAIARAGIRSMEVTSFVSPKVIPQLSDAAKVMASIERAPGVTYMALIPNLKGAERALAAGTDVVKTVLCTSDSYNRRNVGMRVEESIRDCGEILRFSRDHGMRAEAVIALSFGCPLEGPIPPSRVVEITGRLVAQGYKEISVADSMGLANPVQVRRMMRLLQDSFRKIRFSLHVHNTRGLGLANIFAAWEEGIDEFDSSIGGLGGSDVVVAGASGNVPTEDLTNMFTEMGVETGVDIDKILVASRLAQQALGRPLPSYLLTHGTPAHFYQRVRESEAEKFAPHPKAE